MEPSPAGVGPEAGGEAEAAQPSSVVPADERAIGAPRVTAADAECQASKHGLKYGDYVPTQREIDSGAVQVQEVVAVVRSEGVETDALEPLEDYEAALAEVAGGQLFSKDWNARFDTLHLVRKLIKFAPSILSELITDVGTCLVQCIKNPRSSIIREACMLCTDLLTNTVLMDQVCEHVGFDALVPVLLLKSINDKKFIREAAQNALNQHARCAPHMWVVYIGSLEHKNTKVAASATNIVLRCLEQLIQPPKPTSLSEEELADLVQKMCRVTLHGKLADARKNGKRSLELLEQASSNRLEELLRQVCSKPDAEAAHRLLYPGQPAPTQNCSITEFIATNSPANSPKHTTGSSGSQRLSSEIEPVLVMEKQPVVDGAESEDTQTTRRRALSDTPRARRSSEEVLQLF